MELFLHQYVDNYPSYKVTIAAYRRSQLDWECLTDLLKELSVTSLIRSNGKDCTSDLETLRDSST